MILKTAGNSEVLGNMIHYALYQARYCPTEPFKPIVRTLSCLSYAHLRFIALHYWFALNTSGQKIKTQSNFHKNAFCGLM